MENILRKKLCEKITDFEFNPDATQIAITTTDKITIWTTGITEDQIHHWITKEARLREVILILFIIHLKIYNPKFITSPVRTQDIAIELYKRLTNRPSPKEINTHTGKFVIHEILKNIHNKIIATLQRMQSTHLGQQIFNSLKKTSQLIIPLQYEIQHQ